VGSGQWAVGGRTVSSRPDRIYWDRGRLARRDTLASSFEKARLFAPMALIAGETPAVPVKKQRQLAGILLAAHCQLLPS
jgi:hypothetical protein